jgi:putative surface cell wall-binding protein
MKGLMFDLSSQRLATSRLVRLRALFAVAAAIAALLIAAPAALAVSDTTQFSVTAGTLSFNTSPDVPNLPALTLNGQSQTLNAQMNNYAVADASGSGAGWNVTVNGDASGGKSAVFKQYCPNATCGTDSGPGYVASGATLGANSLTLNSTSATFSAVNGTTGTAPTHSCNTPCFVDAASPVKTVSAASGAGMGTYQTSGYTATSLALTAPTTIKALQTNEYYKLDLVWTLNSGP